MRIALLGYGKMGKTIEKLATAQGHSIVLATNDTSQLKDFNKAQVAIDFSTPEAALTNCKRAIEAGVPVVSGTTGWLDDYDNLVAYCKKHRGAFLYASNFSLGVNIFFAINEQLARLMEGHDYQISMEEIHHTQKLDAPSGTAISLAEQLLAHSTYKSWGLEATDSETLPIKAIREGDVKGTHEVCFNSPVDRITIKHEAHSRDGFALGAIIAANWMLGKEGIFSMKDVLNIR